MVLINQSTATAKCRQPHWSPSNHQLSSAILFLAVWTDVVPAPKNLQFSEVTQTSFRVTWEQGAPDVALYRIGWSRGGEGNYQFVS